MNSKSNAELLPCPFCGEHPVAGGSSVWCPNKDCWGPEVSQYANLDDAVAAWNRRPSRLEATPEQRQLVEQIVAGTAPMSKWMGSVDYHDMDGFQAYLERQLREKLSLKVTLDPKRQDDPESEGLATFVDGAIGVLESVLATFRTVREREVASRLEAISEVEPVASSASLARSIALHDAIAKRLRPFMSRDDADDLADDLTKLPELRSTPPAGHVVVPVERFDFLVEALSMIEDGEGDAQDIARQSLIAVAEATPFAKSIAEALPHNQGGAK